MNQGEDFHRIEGPIEESASEERENQIADRQNINSRTKELTKLLCNYVETYRSRVRQSNELRDNFYLISVSLLIFLSVGFPLVILCLLWCGKIADVNAAVGLISSCAVIATSVIVLPKTIAEYLFSTEEDSNIDFDPRKPPKQVL